MKVALGGTFDHLHDGHRKLLSQAASYKCPVLVGLTTDALLSKKQYREYIQDYEARKENVEQYLKSQNVASFEIVPLVDKYGPAISDPEISVILVTEETKPTALEINRIRKDHNLLLLEIVVVDPVVDENTAVISSTNIRKMLHNCQKREN